jgi:hypothetical protein
MTRPHTFTAPLLAVLALAAAGCSATDPYAATTVTTRASARTASDGASAAAVPRARDAAAAIRNFTTRFINWRFADLPEVKRQLAAQATGPLAEQLRQDAQRALTETSRRVSNQANEGAVELVNNPKNTGDFYVVTHETAKLGDTHAQGGYFVYRASARRVGNIYKLSTFNALS